MKKVFKHKKIALLFILFTVLTVTTVSKLSKSSLFTSLRKNKTDYTEVQDGDNSIDGTDAVTFDVYFLKDKNNDGQAEGYRGSKINYGYSDKLYFDFNVSGDVTVKKGKITFVNDNVKIGGVLSKSSVIPKNLSNTDFKTIELSDMVNNGTSSFFYLNVSPYIENDLNKFNGVNKVIFEATIVDNITGSETPVRKEIEYTVDTEATNINAQIFSTGSNDVTNKAIITYTVEVRETNNQMPMKASYLTGSVSDFEGLHPSNVQVTSGDGNVDFNYDPDTQTFTAVKNAVVNDKVITRQAYNNKNNSTRINKWYITVTYPVEENMTILNKSASINVKAYNTGFSNIDLDEVKSNEVNKIISHMFTILPEAPITFADRSKIYLGSYASSIENYFVDKTHLENVYTGLESSNFVFDETWNLDSTTDMVTSLRYQEIGNNLGRSQKTNNFTTYKTAKITTKPNIKKFEISVIDLDTNETLFIINNNNYTEEFEFPPNVRKVKLITNKIESGTNFKTIIKFSKEINAEDIVEQVPLEDFITFGSMSNGGYVYEHDEENALGVPFNGNAAFSDTYSKATLTATNTQFTREISETSIPMTFSIEHNQVDAASKFWKEGYYLLRLPKEIIDVENLNVIPSGGLISSEVYKVNGINYIKIIYNNSGVISNPAIKVSFNSVLNPKEKECNGNIELYAINNTNTLYNNATNDIYDVNGNGSTNDKASYSRLHITIAAPKELLTGAIISDYDEEGSTTISPLIADIDPTRGDNDANVNIFVINNSSFKVKDIDIVGKVAFQGNTYEGIPGDLGSEYDVEMSGPIQVPESLRNKVTVYYSTNPTPTKDVDLSTNGWTTEVSDYSSIKTYLIKFDGSVNMSIGETYDFYYPINMPNTTNNLLKKTYFNHGIYFNRVTEAGTVSGKVTSPKLGVQMARKYDLNLSLFKPYSLQVIPGGQYILTDSDNNSKIISIDSNGNALVKGLYVGKEYTLKQYSSVTGYIKDDEEKTFKVTNEDDDSLLLTKNGKYKRIEYSNDNVLNIDLENEMLYTLDLHNIDTDSNANIGSTIFKVTGKNHVNGTNIVTDSEGHAYLKNMVLGETYQIEQVKIDGYAKVDNFKIKIERDPNTHNIKILKQSTPTISLGTCDSIFSQLSENSVRSNPKLQVSGGTYKCNILIDLTNYRERYKIKGDAYLQDWMDSSNNPNVKYSLIKNEENVTINPFLNISRETTSSSWYYVYKSFDIDKAYEKVNNTYTPVDIKGGDKYYITVNYLHGRYYINGGSASQGPSTQIYNIKINSLDSDEEFIFQDDIENVNPKNNLNVSQTIYNYNLTDTNSPILEVEVRNKYIKKVTLNITKKDGETGDILSGAQYKITGPGLPGNGKYLTIDSNGHASIDLYLSYTGAYNQIPGMNNNYPKENYYTLEEVTPPKGYSKEDKPVIFSLTSNVLSSNGELSYNYLTRYNLDGIKFDESEIDKQNIEWNVVLNDYPIIKVKKTDEETDEVLPNTYYAIYKVTREDGNETVEFAKDDEGNYIGEKLTIDGEDYYVVKTNDKGELTLNLSSGTYQLKEVQAADDKYEISDQIHYFGVGETIPYHAAGLSLVDGFAIENLNINEYTNIVKYTSDGGMIVVRLGSYSSGPIFVTKYDADHNVIFDKMYYSRYGYTGYYTYFDDPDRKELSGSEYMYTNYSTYTLDFKETSDAYYLLAAYNNLIKIDKDTGEEIFNSGEVTKAEYINEWYEYCDKYPNSTYRDIELNPNNETQYYCRNSNTKYYNYFNNDYYSHGTITDNGEAYVLSRIQTGGDYHYKLKDGTIITPSRIDTSYYNGYEDYILKFNNKGELVDAISLYEKLQSVKEDYINEHYPNLEQIAENSVRNSYGDRFISFDDFKVSDVYINNSSVNDIKQLPNGDLILVAYDNMFEYNYKYLYYDREYSTSSSQGFAFAVRFDSNFNVKNYMILGANGVRSDIGSNSNYYDALYKIYDDGHIDYLYDYTVTAGGEIDTNTIDGYMFSDEDHTFELPVEEGHPYGYSANVLYTWDKDFKPVRAVEIARSSKSYELADTTNDMKRMYNFGGYFTVIPVEDGYIIGNQMNSQGYTTTYSKEWGAVELASGETIYLDGKNSYVLYKVNYDSSIEWVKQYGNINTNRFGVNFVDLQDDKILLYRISAGASFAQSTLGATDGEIVVSKTDPDYYHIKGDSSAFVGVFQLKDEVQPEVPEAFSLNLKNKRKEYKVKITNNEGGSFDITDNDSNVVYQGNKPGEIETIKYGDNSQNNIKIIPNRGYGIKEITVNGSKASFSVDNDGNVILDKFNNVREDKNVNVTFELGQSRVVVHHYLKDTTTKIASDELLTGRINSTYETEAKIDSLYTLAKDSSGDYIVPANSTGKYTVEPIEVTYYYDYNMVKLIVNFYKQDTEEPVANSIESVYSYGSRYLTEALNIEHYTVVGIIGEEVGTLTNDITEVTYLYNNAQTAIVEVNYVDLETGLPVANQVTKVIPINTRYETDKLAVDPDGYEYSHSEGDVVGTISEADAKVVVTYFYKRIKSNITTRYLDPETKKDITEKNIQVVNIGDRYETHELDNIPKGYKLKEVPDNASGIADKKDIEVVYYYEKIKEVKDEEEIPDVPNTLDNSFKYVILGFTSIIGLIISYKIKKKVN